MKSKTPVTPLALIDAIDRLVARVDLLLSAVESGGYLARSGAPQTCANPHCPRPGRQYIPRRRDQMYCSNPCKMEAFRQRKIAKGTQRQLQRVTQRTHAAMAQDEDLTDEDKARIQEVGIPQWLSERYPSS